MHIWAMDILITFSPYTYWFLDRQYSLPRPNPPIVSSTTHCWLPSVQSRHGSRTNSRRDSSPRYRDISLGAAQLMADGSLVSWFKYIYSSLRTMRNRHELLIHLPWFRKIISNGRTHEIHIWDILDIRSYLKYCSGNNKEIDIFTNTDHNYNHSQRMLSRCSVGL